MNWGVALETACWLIAGIILLAVILGLFRDAVIKVKKAGAYRAELDAPELGGYGGKITVRVDSEEELIKFLQRYATDVTRWAMSPDRKKTDR